MPLAILYGCLSLVLVDKIVDNYLQLSNPHIPATV
jgi:hypothetical protein